MSGRLLNRFDLKRQSYQRVIITFLFILFCVRVNAQHDPYAISFEEGKLVYFSDEENNRIPDYSHAGYQGGGVNLPDVAVKIEIGPISGDNRAHIQSAINQVSKMPKDSNGHRGAILLKPGNYWLNGNLYIRESGVVLRGAGDGEDPLKNTVIKVAKAVKGTVIQVGNEEAVWYRSKKNSTTRVKTPYIPVGARSFEVYDPEKVNVGDNIILRLKSTQKWLDSVNGGDTGSDPAWEPGYLDMFYNRTVVSKQDSVITMDAPVYNHVDTTLSTPVVYQPIRSKLVTESGVENLRIDIQTRGVLSDGHAENGVVFRGVENAWARNVTVLHFMVSGFRTHTSKNVTIKDSRALEPHSKIKPGYRYNFNVDHFSSQILFTHVRSSDARRDFVSNGTSVSSGIVFHKSESLGALNSSEGHQKWTQGLLYDSITFLNSQFYNVLSLHNRADFGSSHGWASVHSTAWNVEAEGHYVFVQKPPGAQNYGIGNRAIVNGIGLFEAPEGYIQDSGMVPVPTSLYDAQLADRMDYGLPPDMPLNFRLSDEKEGSVIITWKQLPPQETEIAIERSEDGIIYVEIAKANASDQYFEDQDVKEKEYYYRIRALRDGQYSVFTFPQFIAPQFTKESLSDFDLTAPSSDAIYINEDKPDSTIRFEWEEAESKLEIKYRWHLTDKTNDNKLLIERDSLQTQEVVLTFGEILDIMIEKGIEEGDSLQANWTVFANSETLYKQAKSILPITFHRPVVLNVIDLFDTDLLNGEEAFLDQNYPNPFNPLTTIQYHLAEDSHVRLAVYNISGVKVSELEDGFKERGSHAVTFEAGDFASGVYFYRLQTGNVVQIRKMTLIK